MRHFGVVLGCVFASASLGAEPARADIIPHPRLNNSISAVVEGEIPPGKVLIVLGTERVYTQIRVGELMDVHVGGSQTLRFLLLDEREVFLLSRLSEIWREAPESKLLKEITDRGVSCSGDFPVEAYVRRESALGSRVRRYFLIKLAAGSCSTTLLRAEYDSASGRPLSPEEIADISIPEEIADEEPLPRREGELERTDPPRVESSPSEPTPGITSRPTSACGACLLGADNEGAKGALGAFVASIVILAMRSKSKNRDARNDNRRS
jgi:hypothetical protein